MKVKFQGSDPTKKLVAVVGGGENGVFFRYNGGSLYVGGVEAMYDSNCLENIAKRRGRKPVYEGDTITITF